MEAVRQSWTDDRLDDLSDRMDQRFEQVDQRFEQVDKRFEQVDQRFDRVENGIESLRAEMNEHNHERQREFHALYRVILYAGAATVTALLGVCATFLGFALTA